MSRVVIILRVYEKRLSLQALKRPCVDLRFIRVSNGCVTLDHNGKFRDMNGWEFKKAFRLLWDAGFMIKIVLPPKRVRRRIRRQTND